MSNPRLLLVSPRPPRSDGQGDQRRAAVALAALARDWDVEVISWLPDADDRLDRRQLLRPGRVARALALATVRPLQVAYVQSLAPSSVYARLRNGELALFMTDRAVPLSPPGCFAIDFIDDLGGAALRRATGERGLRSWFWRWEGSRLRRLDARLAARAAVALAITEHDAAALSPAVTTIRAATARVRLDATTAGGGRGKVAFTGNLFYQPNLEAATWICEALAPELQRRGLDPASIVIAGRRPPAGLEARAQAAGVDLRADVDDLGDVLREADVVMAPVVFGSGVQNKILDAVGAGRPCVITPFTNQALGLVDGRSAVVRDRSPESFADAIMTLLGDPEGRREMAAAAARRLAAHSEAAVHDAWRTALAPLRGGG